MAKLKKSARKGSARKSASGPGMDTPAQAERLGKSITESAQQIWLAGMGAFNRAQSEGGKLFDSLVRDGLSLEQTARKIAGNRADVVRDAVEGTVGQARERAADTWDKLEKVFEDRVQRALVKLGVPGREDLHGLTVRVERLTAELRRANGGESNAHKAPRKAAAPKAAASKPAASKAAASKTAGKKVAASKAAASKTPSSKAAASKKPVRAVAPTAVAGQATKRADKPTAA